MNTNYQEKKLWKAAVYTRLSREDGDKDESDSISNQRELIRSFIMNKPDIEPISDYDDDGYSGVNYDRPAFNRVLADIKNGLINCIVVKDLSRLGRNYIETGKLLERFFPFMGVRFIAINDNYDSLNHNGQTDNIIIPFKNLINDAYCADTSRKIRSQFEIKRKKGDFIGSFTAYGYKKDPNMKNHLVIDEETAPIVRDIFSWKISGMSSQGIADKLNGLGILSPLEYKKACGSRYTTVFDINAHARWTHIAVGRILKNELYAGVLIQGISTTPNYKIKQRMRKPENEWVRIEQAHEAIISPEDFSLVAGLLKKDTRITPGGNVVYLFSGLIYCGDCGRSLVRKPVKNSTYAYFVCSTYKKGNDCSSHSINEKEIYNAVFQVLTIHIQQCVEISRIIDFIDDIPLNRGNAKKVKKQIEQKQIELEKLLNRKARLYEDYADGIMSRDEYMRLKTVFDTRSVDADNALAALQTELENIASGGNSKQAWIEHFKKYQGMQCLTRTAVVELVERITVYEKKKIKVTIHYQDEFKSAMSYLEPYTETDEKAVV